MTNQEFQNYAESEVKGMVSSLMEMRLDKGKIKAVARLMVSTKIADQTGSKKLSPAQIALIQSSAERIKI